MFVESMMFAELRKEFEKDKPALMSKVNSHLKDVRRQMRRTNISKVDKHFDWTSPNKNIWSYRLAGTGWTAHFDVTVYCLFFTDRSHAVIMYGETQDMLVYYSSHFFTRYFERQLQGSPYLKKIISGFMDRNDTFAFERTEKLFDSRFDIFVQMKEGVAFGTIYDNIRLIELRTFIRNDMLKGDQVALSKSLDEEYHLGAIRKKEEK